MTNNKGGIWQKIKHSFDVYYNGACIDIDCDGKRYMWSHKKMACDKCGRSDMENYQAFSWNTFFLILIVGGILIVRLFL